MVDDALDDVQGELVVVKARSEFLEVPSNQGGYVPLVELVEVPLVEGLHGDGAAEVSIGHMLFTLVSFDVGGGAARIV